MLIAERHEKIVHTVSEKGSVRVTELSKLFGITAETIRRDLEKLEQSGKLIRSHGGAVSVQEKQIDTPFFERETEQVSEKKKIAKIALEFIKEDESILLDASSTSWFLAKELPNMPLTVITNSMRIVMELAVKNHINVICTGGNLRQSSLSFVGPLTSQSLSNYHTDRAFISCKALDLGWGISDSNDVEAMVKRKMLQVAEVNYMLIDHSKIGRKATAYVANPKELDYLITDKYTDQTVLNDLSDYGMEVITV